MRPRFRVLELFALLGPALISGSNVSCGGDPAAHPADAGSAAPDGGDPTEETLDCPECTVLVGARASAHASSAHSSPGHPAPPTNTISTDTTLTRDMARAPLAGWSGYELKQVLSWA